MLGGLKTHREIYIPTDDHFARFIDVLHNPGNTPITRRVSGYGNLGSDGSTVITGSGSGDLLLGVNDTWLGTDDSNGSGDLSLAHVFMDGQRQTLVAASRNSDNLDWSFDVTIGPEQTVRLMTFAVQESDRITAQQQAERLVGLPANALAYLSDDEKGSILNFDTGLDSLAPFVTSVLPVPGNLPEDSVTEFNLVFSEAMQLGAASNPANYTLLAAGSDKTFGTDDDLEIGLTAEYFGSEQRVRLSLPASFSPLPVGDYRLTLRATAGLTDLAGNELNSGTDAVYGFSIVKPGPIVLGIDYGNPDTSTGWNQFTVTFDRAINGASFSGEDVLITDPTGQVLDTGSISILETDDPRQWTVSFPERFDAGYFQVSIGPDIQDVAGSLMNQDGDLLNGEPWEDRYLTDVPVVSPSFGPRVVNMVAGDPTTQTGFGSFELVFDHEIANLTASDIGIYNFATEHWTDSSQIVVIGFGTNWTVYFPTMYEAGWYYLKAGPWVIDLVGQPMNQDGDQFNGEDSDIWSDYVYVFDSSGGDAMRLAGAKPRPETMSGSTLVPHVAPLDSRDVAPMVRAALDRWAAIGVSSEHLASLQFAVGIRDLPGSVLGLTFEDRIWLDTDAAGVGWFVDATPAYDEEFLLSGSTDSPAAARVDLLTVLMHEVGHLLGFEHGAADEVMSAFVRPGVRLASASVVQVNSRGAEVSDLSGRPVQDPPGSSASTGLHAEGVLHAATLVGTTRSNWNGVDSIWFVETLSAQLLPIETQIEFAAFIGANRRRRRSI
jgi:hypothetical protein